MMEVVVLRCNQDLDEVTWFLKRASRYIEADYVLEEFKVSDSLEAVFTVKPSGSIGFVAEDIKDDN